MPEDLPDPALLLAARDAAYAEWYSLDRPGMSDEQFAVFEPMAFRLLNCHARHLMVYLDMTAKRTD